MSFARHARLALPMLFACLPALAAQPEWKLGFDGIGPLRIGMRFDEARRVLGGSLKRTELAEAGCDQIPLDQVPGREHIWLMFVDDVLARVDVEQGAVTERGIKPGDTVKRVLAAYPSVAIEPHAYSGGDRYLTVYSKDRQRALRFETDKGKVNLFYAGQAKAVQWIEGCL